MKIKGIIFDVDGLLVDTERIHVQAWDNVFSPLNIFLTKDDYEKGIGIADREFLIQLKEKGKLPDNSDIEYFCKEKENQFLEIIKKGVPVFNGVIETLKFLKNNNFKIAAASNSKNVFVRNVLKYAHIEDFFDIILVREDVEKPKPAPDIYIKTLELLCLKKNQAIVFEDSEVGISAAKSAGIFCIGVASTCSYDKLKKADIVIDRIEKNKVEKILKGVENENI